MAEALTSRGWSGAYATLPDVDGDGRDELVLGIAYRVLGTTTIDVGVLLPHDLEVGAVFGGSVGSTSAGREPLVIRRRAEVVGREEITTGAGAFEALRLEVADDVSFAGRANRRDVTQWLVRGVGLVRYQESVAGRRVLSLELEAIGDAD